MFFKYEGCYIYDCEWILEIFLFTGQQMIINDSIIWFFILKIFLIKITQKHFYQNSSNQW